MSEQKFRRWPIFLIASPAAVAVWSGWVGLGALCGFGVIHPFPGIPLLEGFRLNTAITLPIGVEAYGAYALGAWLSSGAPEGARKFARRSSIGSLVLGMTGQVAYHILSASHSHRAPTLIVVMVACLPVVTLGFGAALAHLLSAPESAAKASIDATVTAHEVASTQAPRTPLRAAEKAPSASHRKRTRHGKGVPTINEAVTIFQGDIQAGNVPSIRAIKRQLNVGDVKARSYQSHFQTLTGEAA